MIVLDASVATKWFVTGEPERERALSVLDDLSQKPQAFAVPELFFNEMLAVLCRTEGGTAGDIKRYLGHLEDLGLARVGNGHDLLQEAVALAMERRLSGYDAIYAASARLLGGVWLTADRRAVKQLKEDTLAILLADWPIARRSLL